MALKEAARIPGLSIAVVRDGHVVLADAFGMRDLERKEPARPETLYPIGSITKTFTATLMLQLVEQGRLDLEQPVARYVTWEVAPEIRIRHVLSHTSGGTPGARYTYSSRFNWLDDVVTAATGEPFPALLEQGVLQRATLRQTLAGRGEPGYADALDGLAKPHKLDADGQPVRSQFPPMGLHSSSGLSSTVLDLAKYAIALDAGRLLSAESRQRAFLPTRSLRGEPLPYGLGWFSQEVAGQRVVWHGGWWPDAYSGLLVKVPEKKAALVLLANSDALAAPQLGGSNVLLHPVANAFLRVVLAGAAGPLSMPGWDASEEALRSAARRLESDAAREVFAAELAGRALVLRWRRDPARSDALLRLALACCGEAALRSMTDDDRLLALGDSGDTDARRAGVEAGLRVLAAFPDDAQTLFNVAIAQGRVRPELRIQGPDAAAAVALLERILALPGPLPKWMDGWSSYLVAESLAGSDPQRARSLVQRARASGADSDGLQGRVTKLIERLP